MKLNISYPATGCQKLIEIEDEKKLRGFYEKRMGQEVEGDSLGDEWKGYVFRIGGGNDKQGFPMKQGVLTAGRVRLLLSKGHSCYRPRRSGERKRKSVRGCIVDANLSVLALIVKKKGEQEIEGLTDKTVPRRLGPKRASKIRKLFNLTKSDDVRQYVIRHPKPVKEGKKEKTVAPKIQRLITPLMLQHKRRRIAIKRKRAEKRQEDEQSYARLLAQRAKEEKERRAELARKRRSTRESQSSTGGDDTTAKKGKKSAAASADDKPKFKGDKYKGKTAQEYFRMVAARKSAAAARKAAADAKGGAAPAAGKKGAAGKAAAKKPADAKKATPAAKAAPAAKKPAPKKK